MCLPPLVGEIKTYSIFHFQHVAVCEVRRHLKQVTQEKSSGADKLPPGYLTLSGPGFYNQPEPGGEGDESSPLSKIFSAWAKVIKRGMHIT